MSILAEILATASISLSMPAVTSADIAWVLSGEFCEPETVLPLPDNTLLVSNVCGFRERGNGFLSLLSMDGKAIDWRIVDKLNAPLGMALLSDRLYVVDANQVRVLSWPGYEPIEIIDLDTKVANDIAVAADGSMFVSDTAQGLVLHRQPDGKQSILTGHADFEGANGMALSGDHLYIGGARLWCVNLKNGARKTIGPQWLADIDGIEFEKDGTLQLTPVGGPLVRYRSDSVIQVLGGDGVSSANHGFAAATGLALIPTGYDNTVVAIRVPLFPPE